MIGGYKSFQCCPSVFLSFPCQRLLFELIRQKNIKLLVYHYLSSLNYEEILQWFQSSVTTQGFHLRYLQQAIICEWVKGLEEKWQESFVGCLHAAASTLCGL